MSNPVSYKSKADSRFMRILAFLLAIVGNKRFMEDFWTTVGTNAGHIQDTTLTVFDADGTTVL